MKEFAQSVHVEAKIDVDAESMWKHNVAGQPKTSNNHQNSAPFAWITGPAANVTTVYVYDFVRIWYHNCISYNLNMFLTILLIYDE